MDKAIYKQPMPAVGLAIGAGVLAHAANLNAANALKMSPAVTALVVAALVAALGMMAAQGR